MAGEHPEPSVAGVAVNVHQDIYTVRTDEPRRIVIAELADVAPMFDGRLDAVCQCRIRFCPQ